MRVPKSQLRSWFSAASTVAFAAGVALAQLLSGAKYDGMDGSAVLEDPSGDRALVVSAVLLLVSLPQVVLLVTARGWEDRRVPAALLVIALALARAHR